MAGYIGSKSSVTLVDGYSEAEADAEFVAKSTTGDLTLDVSGDIILDANGTDVRLAKGGVQYGMFTTNSTPLGFYIDALVQDGDLFFRGNDGGSTITAMTIDMSAGGNVGIGTSSPSYTLDVYKSSVGNVASFNSSSGNRSLDITSADNGAYLGAEWDRNINSAGGIHTWSVNDTERMRISSAGNVGISNSIPDSFYAGGNNLVVGSGSGSEGITIYGGLESNLFFADGTAIADNLRGRIEYSHGSDGMLFYTNNSYAMRIDSSGRLLVGRTNATFSQATGMVFHPNGTAYMERAGDSALIANRFTNNGPVAEWCRDGTQVGSVSVTGSSTSYNTSSDYRLKENVVDLTGASARVNQLDVKRFNFIADETNTLVDGFLAHEVATVVPEAINGTKDAMKDEEYEVTPATGDIYTPATDDVDEVIHSADAEQPETLEDGQQWRETTAAVMGTRSVPDYQGIDQSKLVPLLTAALQEALTEIASLKTRVEALEA